MVLRNAKRETGDEHDTNIPNPKYPGEKTMRIERDEAKLGFVAGSCCHVLMLLCAHANVCSCFYYVVVPIVQGRAAFS